MELPFRSLDIAKLYLRTADYARKTACGIYEIKGANGRTSYKIFADDNELQSYLEKDRTKSRSTMKPLYQMADYKEYENTQVRKLSAEEVIRYLSER